MSATIPGRVRRTKNPAQCIREPPLRVDGFPGADRFANLHDDHPMYKVARFAWHYGDQLDDRAGRALQATLLEGWPRKRGLRDNAFDDTRAAFAADRLGVSRSEIATAWTIKPDTADRKIRRGRAAAQSSGGDAALRIVVVDDYLVTEEVEGILPEPCDPADSLEGALLRDEPTPEQWAESRCRLIDAAAMGLPERVTLDVLLPDGCPRVEISTASREAAWQAIDRVVEQHGGYPPEPELWGLRGWGEEGLRVAVWLGSRLDIAVPAR